MAKQNSSKSNVKHTSTREGKTVTDKYNRTWNVDGWEERFGQRVARVIHPLTSRVLFIANGGEQFRVNAEGDAFVKAYKRYPLNPASAGAPATASAGAAPATASAAPSGKGVEAPAQAAGAATAAETGNEFIGLRMKLTPRALDLVRRYEDRLGSSATRERVGAAVSAVLVQHFAPLVDSLENEQIALNLLRERGIELTPEQQARLRASA